MDAKGLSERDGKSRLVWHLYLVPLNVAIGSSGILTTLIALSLGANVADIGVMTAAGAVASIAFSTLWGRLSDLSGVRKNYLIVFFVGLGPIFLVMSRAGLVWQLILLYTLLSVFTSGITPIAVMYSVENCRAKNWEREVARYNSFSSVGAILGLVVNTVVALFLRTSWLFYVSAAMCFLSAIMLWKTGREPEITLERHFFPIGFHDVERFLSSRLVFHNLSFRPLRLPKSLSQFKPLQLLFLACLVHWTGIFFFSVGQTPLMKDLGLSDSMILGVNAAANAAAAISFVRIAPYIKMDHKKMLSVAAVSRGGLILCWAALALFAVRMVSIVFIFLMALSVIFNVFYAVIWLMVTNLAVSQAPADRKGVTQGELLSVVALANAVGSILGGVVITTLGFTIGFVIAALTSVLAVPIILRTSII